ncbi:3'(2'),5'-bisphosphate nucleotidase CysQ [Alphaproteobacteria bacterium GH1-50]|uniref:3'(2'),5'-bisphosphate nucleotidase CysQ n=1 Tax=Kangsaoukella pontilimi TaxID=2691042 RepID=A0A7C9MFB9_9RHOB|nr:3'(2'),5'-bisphosphate nucleotidase CysQ [Kangsaoukella pontilimi]MXQ09431.1 3'(2'),5'-bisphosphate nucleotidase CysQ [Kangsaoukella pontilimi]
MPGSDLALLIDAAHEAGEIARSFWREDPQVWDKGGDDPVSEADFAVDRHLRQRLLAARPDYGWVSEETEDDSARLKAERVFIVDPIDGTRSFVKGEPTWAHSLAIAENGRPVAGVVFLPVRDKLYTAETGKGAALNGAALTARAAPALDGADILAPRVTFAPEFWAETPPEVTRHFRPSLAYRMALVAEGRFDAMMTLRNAWEWDIAAGAVIVEEAGAAVRDRLGRPLTFNAPSRQTAGVLAGGAGLVDDAVRRLARPGAA